MKPKKSQLAVSPPSPKPSQSSASSLPGYLLMAGILAFGAVSATLTLRQEPAQAPATVPVQAPAASTATVAAPSSASTQAVLTASQPTGVSAGASGPAAVQAPVASAPLSPAVPPISSVVAPASAVSQAPAAAVEPKPAAVPAREPVKKAQNKPAAKPSKKDKDAGDSLPVLSDKPVAPSKASEADSGAPVAAKPATVSSSVPEPAAKSVEKPVTKPSEADPSKPVVKAITAPALVPTPPAPVVVMATEEKAWVKLDDRRTVIVPKGSPVQGLGVYHGVDGRNAKFDAGSQPVISN